MLKFAVIIGSTRPGRIGEGVAKWVCETLSQRDDAQFELVDLLDFNLPLLDEPVPASAATHYTKDHTKIWSEKIASFDGFIFVAPEYNHGVSAALKNAIDFLYKEWNNKVAGFVSYGGNGGTRSVEHLKDTLIELQIAIVRTQLTLSLRVDFENFKTFKPGPHHEKTLNAMAQQLITWGNAMMSIRSGDLHIDNSNHREQHASH